MENKQSGFTLLELMVVTAIVGILGSIAAPAYQQYASKSQATAALQDILGAKVTLEQKITEGLDMGEALSLSGSSGEVLATVGITNPTTNRCSLIEVSVANEGTASVTCTMLGSPSISGNTIAIVRSGTGVWTCQTTAASAIAPKGCAST